MVSRSRINVGADGGISVFLVGQILTGLSAYNATQGEHGEALVTLSEFLAIASMVWLAVYLRQRWSPESKPVHAPHEETGR